MTREIRVTDRAREDLRGIGFYIADHDSVARSLYVVEQIEARIGSLSELPERGSYVNELLARGNRRYRQVLFGPYRTIYEVSDDEVIVHLIADGRRNMRALLRHRLG